jgi:LAS superfamily LD-carboxypeptidase LdcB
MISTRTEWAAGTRLTPLETTAPADAPTSAVLAGWARVRAPEEETEGWLPGAFLAPAPEPVESATPGRIGDERVDRWHGLPPDYAPDDLVSVGPRYDDAVNYQLRAEAAAALEALVAAAAGDGIRLYVISAYRPWSKQQQLYQGKLRRSGWVQDTVARPGHSEHQLGTTVDLTDGDEETLLRESFGDSKAGRWLRENAWMYGFAQSYTRHNQPETGYAPEPWHYRYWGPDRARARHAEALGEQP